VKSVRPRMPKRKRGNHPLGLRRSPPPERLRRRVGGYVKMPPEERREAVAELKCEGHSNREIAKLIGVDETTVRRDLAPNGAASRELPNETNERDEDVAPNGAPSESEPETDEDDDVGDDDQMSPQGNRASGEDGISIARQ
jgi:transposase-like protein